MAKQGILYGIGVGPGDPELLTLKGARLIRECPVVAAPDSGAGAQVALEIARAHVGNKPLLTCPMPMVRDQEELRRYREAAADLLCGHLEAGRDVAFLTLGDPTIYSTYLYLHQIVAGRGFDARLVAGVPSFCAAAAALGIGLCEAGQPLHICPGSYPGAVDLLDLPGVKVVMKSGKQLGDLLDLLRERDLLDRCAMVERVGLKGERLFPKLTGSEEDAGYLSLIVVKEERQ